MTIREKEQEFIDDFNELGDWFLQYEYLLESTSDMKPVTEEERTGLSRVPGCQSGVWLVITCVNKKVHIRADSEALIIKGILAIIVSLLDGRTPEELQQYQMRFIEETALHEQLSTDRFYGISSVVKAIKDHCWKQLKD